MENQYQTFPWCAAADIHAFWIGVGSVNFNAANAFMIFQCRRSSAHAGNILFKFSSSSCSSISLPSSAEPNPDEQTGTSNHC